MDPIHAMSLYRHAGEVKDIARELITGGHVPPGLIHACAAIAKGLARSNPTERDNIIRRRWPDTADRVLKAVHPALTVDDLGSEDARAFFGQLIERSILGRAGFTEVPANTLMLSLAGVTASWVREGKATPLSPTALESSTLRLKKIQSLIVVTEAFLRHANSEALFQAAMESQIALQIDTGLLDPAGDGSGDAPASITNGATVILSSGPDAEDVRADFAALFGTFQGDFSRAVLAMHPTTAAQLCLMQNPLGESNLKLDGTGTFFGLPTLVSRGVPFDSNGGSISIIDASAIGYARGGFDLSVARDATVQLETEPTNASAPSGEVAETTLVSLWQNNLIGFLATSEIGWELAGGDDCVVTITGCDYGASS